MDYAELAAQFLNKMQSLRRARPHRHIDEALHGGGFVLYYISLHRDGVLPGDISQEMAVSSARIAAALNKLEGKGLITRRIDKSDRRKILVEITPEGLNLSEKHQRIITNEAAKMLSQLGEHDAKEYVRITGKLAEIMNNYYSENDYAED